MRANLEDEFGDIVAKARRGLGLSADELARRAGLAAGDIEGIEAYRLKPDPERVRALAQALALDPDRLAAIADGAWEPAPVRLPGGTLTLEQVFVPFGSYGENCYILACSETSSSAVIDPGGAAHEILEWLDSGSLRLDLILITHAHGDHVGGLRQLAPARPGVRVAAHPVELRAIGDLPSARLLPADDGAEIPLGGLTVTALHTPGHTPGSTCYRIGGLCFVGDTVFAGSIGRPSGPEVYPIMLADIRTKVLSLPDDTLLLPGHGPATTVGEEQAHNPFFP